MAVVFKVEETQMRVESTLGLLVCAWILWALLSGSNALCAAEGGDGPGDIVLPPQADELLQKFPKDEKLPAALVIHLRTYDMGKQMFEYKRSGRTSVTPESLVFSMPRRKPGREARVSCLVYRCYEKLAPGFVGFELGLECDEPVLSKIQELYKLRLLNATVRLERPEAEKIKVEKPVPAYSLKAAKGEIAFSEAGNEFARLACQVLPFDSFTVPDETLENKTTPITLKLQLEDLPGIRYFFDWEPQYQTWYARENNSLPSQAMVVWQEKAANRIWKTRLPKSLPPGRYSILLDAVYTRQKERQNRLYVTLNDCKREFTWFYPRGWKYGPVFETTRPGDTLIFEAVQAGGGGMGYHPVYLQQDVLMLDSMIITTDLNRKEGD